jgi:uncharacterized protein involved in exopolysaccharide biosynthesis
VYEILEQQLSASRTKLTALERQRAEIVRATDLDAAGARKLNELYTKESRIDRLEREVTVYKQVYLDVFTRYEQARIQVAGRSAQLQVIDLAVPPRDPVSPRLLRDTVLAVGFSVFVGSAALLLVSAMGRGLRPTAG